MEPRLTAPNQIDLTKLPKGTSFTLTTHELQPELEARLKREEADATHQRRKDLVILSAVLGVVGIVSVVCIIVIGTSGATPDNSRWATTLLTSIVSAGLGYMTGKNSK